MGSTRIAACLMVHDDDKWVIPVLDDLQKYANAGIFVNLNDPTPLAEKRVKDHPAVTEILETCNEGRWNQGLQRDNTLRMLDSVRPDIVLFPDSDETFPRNLPEQLERFVADEDALSFWFRLMYLWGDKEHYRNDGLWKRIHHVRAFKWKPDITFIPYPGYACPKTYINTPKKTRFHSDTMMTHWGYMYKSDRERKALRGNCGEKMDDGMVLVNVPEGLLD